MSVKSHVALTEQNDKVDVAHQGQFPNRGVIGVWPSTHIGQTALVLVSFIFSRTSGNSFSFTIKMIEKSVLSNSQSFMKMQ